MDTVLHLKPTSITQRKRREYVLCVTREDNVSAFASLSARFLHNSIPPPFFSLSLSLSSAVDHEDVDCPATSPLREQSLTRPNIPSILFVSHSFQLSCYHVTSYNTYVHNTLYRGSIVYNYSNSYNDCTTVSVHYYKYKVKEFQPYISL